MLGPLFWRAYRGNRGEEVSRWQLGATRGSLCRRRRRLIIALGTADKMSIMATVERLPPALKDQSAGATIIKDVRVEVREDSSDAPALFIVLVLSDPPSGMDSWPIDDLWELRRKVREAVAESVPGLDMAWFVTFEPEHPDLPDDEALGLE